MADGTGRWSEQARDLLEVIDRHKHAVSAITDVAVISGKTGQPNALAGARASALMYESFRDIPGLIESLLSHKVTFRSVSKHLESRLNTLSSDPDMDEAKAVVIAELMAVSTILIAGLKKPVLPDVDKGNHD